MNVRVVRPFAQPATRLPQEDGEKFLGALLLLADIAAKPDVTLPVYHVDAYTNDGAPATDTAQETATVSASSIESSLQQVLYHHFLALFSANNDVNPFKPSASGPATRICNAPPSRSTGGTMRSKG